MLYFAYGSNMSEKRLTNRQIHAEKYGVGKLEEYELICNKISTDDSVKFNIRHHKHLNVYGVVYNIPENYMRKLDIHE